MTDKRWFAPEDSVRWVGLDVGGANLKAADGHGLARCEPFELWKRSAELGPAIHKLLSAFGSCNGVALTMTGELADCYETKAEGVRAIIEATVRAAGPTPVRVAAVDDRWLTPAEAIEAPGLAAAANWRVAARLVAQAYPEGRGLWLDVGSTTTDAVPVLNGRVASRGATDAGRLAAGELVYTGGRRTPVCALIDTLPYRGGRLPVAAEWFATAADVWLVLGEMRADPARLDTADGRPFTVGTARDRLARCLCMDRETFTAEDAFVAAEAVAANQAQRIADALIAGNAASPDWGLVSGEAVFLGRRAIEEVWPELHVEFLSPQFGRDLPAHACAVLAVREIE